MSRVKVNSLMEKCNYKAWRFERRAVLEVETTLQELPSTTKLEKNNKNGIDIRCCLWYCSHCSKKDENNFLSHIENQEHIILKYKYVL